MTTVALVLIGVVLGQTGPRGVTGFDGGVGGTPDLPVVRLTGDDTRIERSCRVEIAPGTVIRDVNGDGVIHVVAEGVTVVFAPGTLLRGSEAGVAPDSMQGVGVRVQGVKGVVLRGLNISGFKVGVLATAAPGLVVDGCRFDDNFRQHLKSTDKAEDASDWLWPHANDKHEWRTNYGAAVCIEESEGVTVKGVTVRRGQNGIILDRVRASRVFDCDCSFLSGWGVAMWRSEGNLVCRNAIDFCVRGYSHGVYNRGQDSAGILMFEQCSGNVIAENSVTHCGDGLFGFAGKEAIGETPAPMPGFSYERRGCNDNAITGNDFSYAPAHGLEMTFSHGNRVYANRFVQNAICGIWGGYSRGTLIAENTFEGNGLGGLERGGVNIEHGADNLIVGNHFTGDLCGVHLWWDDDGDLLKKPGVAAGYKGVSANTVAGNTFTGVKTVLHVRDLSVTKDKVQGTMFVGNTVAQCATELDVTPGVQVATKGEEPMYMLPDAKLAGEKKPVGARKALEGRQAIVMTEWGPWDHETAIVRKVGAGPKGDIYAVLGEAAVELPKPEPWLVLERLTPGVGESSRFALHSVAPGLAPYDLAVTVNGRPVAVRGAAMTADWVVSAFPWTIDPREDVGGWRANAAGGGAMRGTVVGQLSLPLGQAGPRGLEIWKGVDPGQLPGASSYGITATTTVYVPQGRWRVTTLSDDGVWVRLSRPNADGSPGEETTLIKNWTWHGPTKDAAEFEQTQIGPVKFVVEYFQLDGYAVLDLTIEPAK